MSIFFAVIAWVGITVGALSAGRYLIMLSRRVLPGWLRSVAHARPAQSERTRRDAWQWFRLSVFALLTGVLVLAMGQQDQLARWLVAIAATVVLLWDRALWFRSRMRRRASGVTT